MIKWQRHEHTFEPELICFAVRPPRSARDERHIEPKLANRRDMIRWITIDQLDLHPRMLLVIGLEQFGKEA
jgi:hypothetical protein